MKKTSILALVFVLANVLGGASSAQTLQLKPIPLPGMTFTSTVPSPLVLRAGQTVSFTINGSGLDSIRDLTLVNTRTRVWSLMPNIVSKTKTALTARMDVPKYLAPGSYAIKIRTTTIGQGDVDTGLAAQGEESKPSAVWTEFLPELHGYAFGNYKGSWGKICWTLVGGRLEYSENGLICDDDWGLCGGMSLVAGERFRSGSPGTHSQSQEAAKPDDVNGQFRTLDGPTIAKFFEWMYSPDVGQVTNPYHSVGYRMQQDWNGLIKPQLDAHKPVVLGLIFDKKATLVAQLDPTNIADLFKQHQVLGIGYTRIGTSTVRLVAYDPNYPNEILVLTFESGKTGVTQAFDSGMTEPRPAWWPSFLPWTGIARRPIRGVMFVHNVS